MPTEMILGKDVNGRTNFALKISDQAYDIILTFGVIATIDTPNEYTWYDVVFSSNPTDNFWLSVSETTIQPVTIGTPLLDDSGDPLLTPTGYTSVELVTPIEYSPNPPSMTEWILRPKIRRVKGGSKINLKTNSNDIPVSVEFFFITVE